MKKIQTKNRETFTSIPSKYDLEVIKKLQQVEPRSMHGQLPVAWKKAEGHNVYDELGNKFIDFTSGICVTNLGHNNRYVTFALKLQLNKHMSYSYTFATEARLKYLKELINNTPKFCEKAFLVSSGTEATEVACKLMLMYGDEGKRNKDVILSFNGAMHGRTMFAEKLKGSTSDNRWAGVDYGYPQARRFNFPKKDEEFIPPKGLSEYICGIIIESYQGWSAKFYPKKYIQDLVKWANENDVLVCFDEIQSGFGRTGKMFAFEHYEVEPDLICCGKGMSGILPLSGVLGRKKILDIPKTGSMSSTFSANPLCCTAGYANLVELKKVLPTVKKKAEYMQAFLRENFKNVNGKGMVSAIITKSKKEADRICYEAMKKGVLCILTGKKSVKIAPPLTISMEALIEGLNVLKEIK